MNRIRFALLVFGLFALTGSAQAQEQRVKAEIPFSFMVGKQLLPAGQYWISTGRNTDKVILLRSDGAGVDMFAPTNTCESLNASGDTKLVFHTLDGHYFLYQIWREGDNRGQQLRKSAAEKELAEARNPGHPTSGEVIVAAQLVR
jgi:hypothetical protein